MKKYIHAVQDNYATLYKFFLFGLSLFLIVLLFPKEVKFNYEFQQGKPWMHDDLMAPFDFAIYKSDGELTAEKNLALQNFKPFFTKKTALVNQKRMELQTAFDSKWAEKYGSVHDQKYTLNHTTCFSLFDTIYSKGIIELPENFKALDQDFEINVLTGSNSEERELASFFTVQSAYKYGTDFLNLNKQLDGELLNELLANSLSQNIIYDSETNDRMRQSLMNNISLTRGGIQIGEKIIAKGDLITKEKYQILKSLKLEYEDQLGGSSRYYSVLYGQIILVFISILVLALFLNAFRKDVFADNKKILLILLLIFFMVFVTSQIIKYEVLFLYTVPICIVPIIIRAFFDTRLALFVHIVTIITIGFLAPNSFEFVFLELIAGIIAIISIVNLRKRSQLFFTSLLVFLTYTTIYIGLILMQGGKLQDVHLMNIKLFAGSALLTLFSYPLIFAFEKIFGFVTDVSLMELSDSNSKLLRQLSERAPGTFQHSIQVANLAEEAIYHIGGNPLLVRAGAMYHDIGKMDMPMFFSENQVAGINPHDELPYDESAKIIISHIIKGIEKAKKANLPDPIIDFIRTHHGTKRTQYFYSQFCKQNEPSSINDEAFTYHGPIPFSKETAVVMISDAIEAASRSIQHPDEESVGKLVDSIIDNQIKGKQFNNSDITFKDISVIKKVFKKRLMNIYHIRIEYPNFS